MITTGSPNSLNHLRDGRYALQSFPQPKLDSDELYAAGDTVLLEDASARADIFNPARHIPHPSEIAFELWLERIMHTWGKHPLTLETRPVPQKWRSPRSG